MNLKVQKFLDRLGTEIACLKLLIGTSRSQNTEAIFIIDPHEPAIKTGDLVPELIDLDEAPDLILEEAENLGWGTDHTHLRINAINDKGGHLKSLTLSKPLQRLYNRPQQGDSSTEQAFQYMAQVVDRSNRVLVETVSMLSHSLDHERAVNAEMVENWVHTKRELVDAEGAVLALNMALDDDSKEEKNALNKEALEQLGSIAKTIMKAKQPAPPSRLDIIAQLKNYVNNDPELIRAAMADESLAAAIMEEMMGDTKND